MDDLPSPDGTLAEKIGASDTALASWAALAARSPDDPAPLLAPIQALLAAGRHAEAGVLLDAAQFRFPDHAPFAVEAARAAQRQGATEDALRRWQAVRDRFPGSAVGLTGAAATLREAGRPAEAEALLAEAASSFPGDPGPAVDYAWLAHARQDWPEALRRWSAVRERFPDVPHGYSGAAVAHRNAGAFDLADALLQDALERFPDAVGLAIEHGWVAHARHDWPEAVRRWDTVRARAPDVPAGYTGGAVALRELGRFAEAEALLREAAERFPAEPHVVVEQAWLAQARRDWPEAARRWDAARARLPGEEVVYTAGARALREEGRADEADRLLREAIARFPDRRSPLTEHAWLAQIGRDWPATVERWAAVRARFPDHAEAYVLEARALAELRRNDEAEPLLAEGVAHLPNVAEIAAEYAELAVRQQNWAAAVRRWEDAAARFPGEKRFSDRLHEARLRMAESDLAAHLASPAAQFAPEPAPETDAAWAQFAPEPAPEMDTAWAQFAPEPAPEMDAAWVQFAPEPAPETDAEWAQFAPPPTPETEPAEFAPAPKPEAADPLVRDLVLQFESLGGQVLGCEFGIFQRDCGAEPLGLLRWADMPYEGIIAVLQSRFAGVGTAETTELFLSPIHGGPTEYSTRDRRGFMLMRTFIREDEAPFDRIYAAACRRLQFLARKLVEDLEAGNKIFVFRLTDRDLTEAELGRLHTAMRSYGDNTLLYVRHEDAGHPNGTVALAGPGLLVGYIDRFKVSRSGEISASSPTASWLQICKNAWELWSALRG
jgi:tetratricopeptide (TPR) repeat protein